MAESSYFDQDSVSRFAGQKYGDIAGLPGWLKGAVTKVTNAVAPGVIRLASAGRNAYKQLDNNVFSGSLPGGTPSQGNRSQASNLQRVYGQLDKNVFHGILPGGAESPLQGVVKSMVKDYYPATLVHDFLENRLQPLGARAVVNPNQPKITGEQVSDAMKYVNSRMNNPLLYLPNNSTTGFDAFYGRRFPLSLDSNTVYGPKAQLITTPYSKVDPSGFQPRVYDEFMPRKGWSPGAARPVEFTTNPNIRYPSSVFFHEAGHALNTQSPFWNKLQLERGMPPPKGSVPGSSALIPVLMRDNQNPPSFMQAGFQGAIANMLNPSNLPTLAEEAAASVRGAVTARRLGLPVSKRLLGGAWSTYAAKPAATGFAEGIAAELGSRAIDWLDDRMTDFTSDRRPPTKVEEQLSQYGFNKDAYRLQPRRNVVGYDNNDLVIEKR